MWIAAITREQYVMPDGTIDDRDVLCRSVLDEAMAGRVEISTSTLSLVEVCKPAADGDAESDALFDFFRHSWILMVSVDTNVGQIGRALMRAGHRPKLKPADATHLASAIVAEATEFQTFDEPLLKLDGKIDLPSGGKLAIKRPSLSGSLPLFIADPGALAGRPRAINVHEPSVPALTSSVAPASEHAFLTDGTAPEDDRQS